jgi:MFS family permease
MGPLSTRLPAHWTLAGVLVVEAAINVMIARNTSPLPLTILLIVEGIGFGVFLVSAQMAVASAAGGTNRGAAVGLFWMAGSLGDLFSPIALGVIAQELGLIAVFNTVAVAALVGAVLVAGFGALANYRAGRDPAMVT